MHLHKHFVWIVDYEPKSYNSLHCHKRNQNLIKTPKVKQVCSY